MWDRGSGWEGVCMLKGSFGGCQLLDDSLWILADLSGGAWVSLFNVRPPSRMVQWSEKKSETVSWGMLSLITHVLGNLLCVFLRKTAGFLQPLISNSFQKKKKKWQKGLKRKLPDRLKSATTVSQGTYQVLDLNLFHTNWSAVAPVPSCFTGRTESSLIALGMTDSRIYLFFIAQTNKKWQSSEKQQPGVCKEQSMGPLNGEPQGESLERETSD